MQARHRSPLHLALGLLTLSALVHTAWMVLRWGGAGAEAWYSDLHYLTVVLAFLAVTAVAFGGSSGPLRPAFAWLLLMGTVRLAAEGTWTYLELILKVPPFPSVADPLYFLGYVTQGAALLLLARLPLRGLGTARLALDSLIVVGAVGVFSWQLFVAGIATDAAEPLLSRLVTLAYPALDLALLSLLLLVVFRNQRLRAFEALFAGGLLLNIIADYLFAYLGTTGGYVTGHPIDALWVWSFVLEGFGVVLAARPSSGGERAAPRWQSGVTTFSPYLALLASFALLIRLEGVQTAEVQGVLWGTAAVTGLVMARQIVMLADNARLNRALSLREAELGHLAHHDPLTGLPNRRALMTELEARVGEAGRGRAALLFADLDGFKGINDTLGHAAGDAALREVAARLSALEVPGAYAARLSGDEFALLLPDVTDGAAAQAVGERLVRALTRPIALGSVSFTVGASVGVALWPDHARTAGELLGHADLAMYSVKTGGKNGVRLFGPHLRQAARRRQDLETHLRGALERGELHLHYQAQGDPRGEVQGAEALLRWISPALGPAGPGPAEPEGAPGNEVPAEQFLRVAEDTGLIVPIGAWVLAGACQQGAAWRQRGLALRVTVNVSPVQLAHSDFAAQVDAALRGSGLPAHALELELSAVPDRGLPGQGLADHAEALAALTARGVTLSLGGVGAGPLDLAHLLPLPLAALKVDRRVVQALTSGSGEEDTDRTASHPPDEAARLLRAVVALARTLGLRVVAQGVEQEWQRRRVQGLGVDAYQGHLLARPLPPAEFEAWWRERRVRS